MDVTRRSSLTRQMLTSHSRFRHVFGSPAPRDRCYEGIKVAIGSSQDASLCAVNQVFLAVIVESTGGGVFLVLPLDRTGRVDSSSPKVCGHTAALTDLKWNPFNSHQIASCSEDSTIKIWTIPDGGLTENLTQWSVELSGHLKRVNHCQWHPTAADILLSTGSDYTCIVWNTKTATAVNVISVDNDLVFSIAWNRDGSLFASTCKDGFIRVVDPRSGAVVAVGHGHDSGKISKVVFIGDNNRLVTTGFSRSGQRQYALWDINDMSTPLTLEDIDSSSSTMIPFYDYDTHVLFLAGKGDGNIRYYEIISDPPYFRNLNQFQSPYPQKDLAMLPKLGVDPVRCEITRFYKLHASKDLCEPVSMILPRKSGTVHSDIFPATAGDEPALSAEEWLNGENRVPVLIPFKNVALAPIRETSSVARQSTSRLSETPTIARQRDSYLSSRSSETPAIKRQVGETRLSRQVDSQVLNKSPEVAAAGMSERFEEPRDEVMPNGTGEHRNDVEDTEEMPTSSVSGMINQFELFSPKQPDGQRRPLPWKRGAAETESHQPPKEQKLVAPVVASANRQPSTAAARKSESEAVRSVAHSNQNAEVKRASVSSQRSESNPLPGNQEMSRTSQQVGRNDDAKKKTGPPSTPSSAVKSSRPGQRKLPQAGTVDERTTDNDLYNTLIDNISTDAPDDTLVRPSALRPQSTNAASRGRGIRRTPSESSVDRGQSGVRKTSSRGGPVDMVDSARKKPTTDAAKRDRKLRPKTLNGDIFRRQVSENDDTEGETPVDHKDLLDKYFIQLEEIKTLKEQLAYKDKKIRRLEDQLRFLGHQRIPAAES